MEVTPGRILDICICLYMKNLPPNFRQSIISLNFLHLFRITLCIHNCFDYNLYIYQFQLMHRLLDALKRIMEPPTKKKRPLSRRSVPLTVKTKPPSLLPKTTDEEIQNLEFFTNYCKQRNNFITYRSKLPDDFDLTFQSKYSNIQINATRSNNIHSFKSKSRKKKKKIKI